MHTGIVDVQTRIESPQIERTHENVLTDSILTDISDIVPSALWHFWLLSVFSSKFSHSFDKNFSSISSLKFLICRQCHLFNYIYLIRLILSLFLLSFQSELGYWRRCWAIYYHVRVIKFNHDCRHIWVSKRIGNAMMYVLSFDSSVKWWLLQFFPECCNLLFLW